MPMCSLRGLRATRLFIVLAVAIAAAQCDETGSQSARSSDSSVAATTPSKYVSAVDEGLGASIAIVLDVSGSMKEVAKGDARPKFQVARDAISAMLETTDSFVVKNPDFPVKVGLITFSSEVATLHPVTAYNRQSLNAALGTLGFPKGGTAIGDAMAVAREELYKAGTFRKYILVVTDGENTDGREPEDVAAEIARRSEGAVRQYFVAFDIDAKRFAFLKRVNGEVLGAANGVALRASLDTIYRGKILAEAMNAGETLPTSAPVKRDTGGIPRNQQ